MSHFTAFYDTIVLVKKAGYLIIFIVWIVPFVICFSNVVKGSTPFWYDPARDLLSAWDNLKKPTLLGPPTGIPGMFYGPYWIWLLSLSLIFTKDPRFAAVLVGIIPYFFIAPVAFYLLKKYTSWSIIVILWLLFILSSINYATYIWNPNLTPAVFLFVFYSLLSRKKTTMLNSLINGLLVGIILNFHQSLGFCLILGMIIFYSVKSLFSKNIKIILNLFFVFAGILITLIPTIAFETRHGFNQSKSFFATLSSALFKNRAVVDKIGLSKTDIVSHYFSKFSDLTHLPHTLSLILIFILFLVSVYFVIKKRDKLNIFDINIVLFVFSFSSSLLAIYLFSPNPVWDYHFVGVEIIFLAFILFLIRNIPVIKFLLLFWTLLLLFQSAFNFTRDQIKPFDPLSIPSLFTKEYIIKKICQEAINESYQINVYSPAIYTFDFDYLIRWFSEIKICNKEERNLDKVQFIYLIIPQTSQAAYEDYINYKTPPKKFLTVKIWQIADGTNIIKRRLK